LILTNGSMLIIESLARAGGEIFIGYPITPANALYRYGTMRFPMWLAAPDEITTLQWMAGFSATGRLPVTATSFPGFALMVESINMAFMMELPMIVILVQRLGPSTGTATCGAQGDLLFLNGVISGGYGVPTMCISSMEDCWSIPAAAAKCAVELRTPVFVLTSKESVMPLSDMDVSSLPEVERVSYPMHAGQSNYLPYLPENNLVPDFLPTGNDSIQTRVTASTHDSEGLLRHSTKEAMANTHRLHDKMTANLDEFTYYELDEEDGSDTLVLSFGITANAAREAVGKLRSSGRKVSLLIAKTLLPVPPRYFDVLSGYERIIVAEENLDGQYRRILFGASDRENVTGVNAIGRMVTPDEILREVANHGK